MSQSPAKSQRWVIGTHACYEAVKTHPHWITEVCVSEGRQKDHEAITSLSEKKRLNIKVRAPKFFNALGDGHQGVAMSLNQRPQWDESVAKNEKSLVVFLDGITDPHNLGAILRTSWLLKVDAVFIPKNRTVDLTPVVCKVACGGAEHVPVESCHFQSQLNWFKEQGYWVYGLSENGQVLLPQLKPADRSVLIVGAEGSGLRSSTENFCDQIITIPQVESGSSYNASVAFALCAYEFRRSHIF